MNIGLKVTQVSHLNCVSTLKRCISEPKFELPLDNVDATDWSLLWAKITAHIALYIFCQLPIVEDYPSGLSRDFGLNLAAALFPFGDKNTFSSVKSQH